MGIEVGLGFVFLYDIRVGEHVWTSATDNGNNNEVGAAEAEGILGEPFGIALGG